MSKAEALREKSKRDDVIIVGSEIRAALQEQRQEIERLRDDNAAHIALSHVAQGDIKRLEAELKQASDFLKRGGKNVCSHGRVSVKECEICEALPRDLAKLETDDE